MQLIQKYGFPENRFNSRFDARVHADSVGVKKPDLVVERQVLEKPNRSNK